MTASANQHSEPALSPQSTTPRRQASARIVVEPVRAPRAEQADDAAAADVDQVLLEQVRLEVALDRARAAVAAEQRDVARLAARGRERAVEAHDVVVGVARRRRDEADPRALARR